MKRLAFILLMLLIAEEVFSKDQTLKLAPTIVYVGETISKQPSGVGTLIISDNARKQTAYDSFHGSFSLSEDGGLIVKDAEVVFANGWTATGIMKVKYEIISSKPVSEIVHVEITDGSLIRDGYPVVIGGGVNLHREIKVGENIFNLILDNIKYNEVYSKLSDVSYYKGTLSDDYVPSGNGQLIFSVDSLSSTSSPLIIEGTFQGNEVHNAIVKVGSSFTEKGSVKYSIAPSKDKVELTMQGELYDRENNMIYSGDSLYVSTVNLSNKSFSNISIIDLFDTTGEDMSFLNSIENYYPTKNAKILKELTYSAFLNESGRKNVEKNKRYILEDDIIVTVSEGYFSDTLSFETPGYDFKIDRSRHGLLSLLKSVEDGLLKYERDGESEIYYKDGSYYKGGLMLFPINSSVLPPKDLGDWSTNMQRTKLITGIESLSSIGLMYTNGVLRHPNGKEDIWKDGITDYQWNKVAGNYDRVVAAMEESLAIEAQKAKKEWEVAKPGLISKYGERYTNALFNCSFINGMPEGLLKAVKDMKLPFFELEGPVEVVGEGGRSYIVSMRNLDTGLLGFQAIVKVRRPYRDAPYRCIYKVTGSF